MDNAISNGAINAMKPPTLPVIKKACEETSEAMVGITGLQHMVDTTGDRVPMVRAPTRLLDADLSLMLCTKINRFNDDKVPIITEEATLSAIYATLEDT